MSSYSVDGFVFNIDHESGFHSYDPISTLRYHRQCFSAGLEAMEDRMRENEEALGRDIASISKEIKNLKQTLYEFMKHQRSLELLQYYQNYAYLKWLMLPGNKRKTEMDFIKQLDNKFLANKEEEADDYFFTSEKWKIQYCSINIEDDKYMQMFEKKGLYLYKVMVFDSYGYIDQQRCYLFIDKKFKRLYGVRKTDIDDFIKKHKEKFETKDIDSLFGRSLPDREGVQKAFANTYEEHIANEKDFFEHICL